MTESKMARLEILRAEVENFTLSPLYKQRQENNHLPVFGEGCSDARLMFISAATGKSEAEYGRPLVGPSGKILDSLLESIHLRRRDVYVTSIVKDYVPGRAPTAQEVDWYAPILDRQIEIIQPGVLATLDRSSTEFLMKRLGVTETEQPAETTYGMVHVFPLPHPAVALYNRREMDNMLDTFRQLAALLA
jgi:uracil-DNA glycosylase family 4